jgi:hypothetical protein
MPEVPILKPERRWECPNCNFKDVTHEARPHTRMHTCRGLKGLTAPMVPEGSDVMVRANVREDYVGKEDVQYDGEGRPIMAVETIRADGSNDIAVLAPCARGGLEAT